MKPRPLFTAVPSLALTRWMRLAVLLAVGLPVAVSAQVVFTVHAKVLFGSNGYVANAPVDFTFVLNDFSPTTPTGAVGSDPNNAAWIESTTADPTLWSGVAGTGITGTWQRPTTTPDSPYASISLLEEHGGTSFSLSAGTDTDGGNDTGLTANGHGVSLLSFSATFQGLTFVIPDATPLPDPTAYFSAYAGDYDVDVANGGQMSLAGGGLVLFDVTGLSIAYTPVPEPATVALIAGLGMLGVVVWRRRRRVAG